ncbi:hypothetical protein CDD80_62 [Ophiocordyceps camponoti-rufipedis]|uniref:Uncharacterized protein n=1 Tax=Ophiocordyceps camponoti-rufipedis TaxID=2004952 RepID=A0A2C5ZMT9_9HYPO|nr:hypothetical protein CDD80_62 [Ophiocordyceps camponoti-rufipedis]
MTLLTRPRFEAVFPRLVSAVLDHARSFKLDQSELDRFKQSLTSSPHTKNIEFNCLDGKFNRALSVLEAVSLLQGKPLDDSQFTQVAALGWALELLHISMLMFDDVMDKGINRRGKPCWYRVQGVGLNAINDSMMLQSSAFFLLKDIFRSHPLYTEILEALLEAQFKTEMGQHIDLLTAPQDQTNLDKFTADKYTLIAVTKTAYSFFLPVALALYYLELATPNNIKQTEEIVPLLTEYFQIQDDYLDNFGRPETIGKIGNDIRENKCSWLVVQALEIATPKQRRVLEENYGRDDDVKERAVKKLYDELALEQRYQEFEEQRVKEIRDMINRVDESEGLKKGVFSAMLSQIYKRSK